MREYEIVSARGQSDKGIVFQKLQDIFYVLIPDRADTVIADFRESVKVRMLSTKP